MEPTSEVNGVGLSNYMPVKNLPPSATTPLSNSYMGCAKVLSYILLAIAVLALAASGFAIHTVLEGSPNAALTPSVVLMSGSCDHIDLWKGGIGLLVNIIAGVCLSISTYMQQLCTSPTHEDIAREMKEKGDVIFGANSPISLFYRFKRRKSICLLWIFLFITSIPIHLFANGSIGVAQTGLPFPEVSIYQESADSPREQLNWTYINGTDCSTMLNEYPQNFDILNITAVITGGFWITVDPLPRNESWYPWLPQTLAERQGGYCLANTINEVECGLVVRWLPLVILSTTLAFKATVVYFGLGFLSHFNQRLYNNLGDLICFAIWNPEFTIPNESLCSVGERRGNTRAGIYATEVLLGLVLGDHDWIVCVLFFHGVAGIWVVVSHYTGFPGYKYVWSETNWDALAGQGALVAICWGWSSECESGVNLLDVFFAVMEANVTQLCISIAYSLFNNQVTLLWQEREWRGFYLNRKKPRTAVASGTGTRSTRWLQLPYILSLTLLSASVLLHWLGAQAVFLIETYQSDFQSMNISVYVMPLPTIVLACLWTALVLAITAMYFLPQRSIMPIMHGSARVVLASCGSLFELPRDGIMWGDITEVKVAGSSKRKAGFRKVQKQ